MDCLGACAALNCAVGYLACTAEGPAVDPVRAWWYFAWTPLPEEDRTPVAAVPLRRCWPSIVGVAVAEDTFELVDGWCMLMPEGVCC